MGNKIGLSLWYEGIIKDLKTGKTVKKKKEKCHSFVYNFPIFLNVLMAQTYNNIGKTISALTGSPINGFSLTASIGSTNTGLWVGTGTGAVTISDYILGSPIGHGTGAGQLQYSAVTFGAPSSTTSDTNFVVTRVYTNGSSGTISVNEIGMIATDAAGNNFLIARDVITPFSVGVGQALTLNYVFRTQI